MSELNQNRKIAFIEFMLEAGALRFGSFTTKSGRKTPYFINTGAYRKGSQLARLGDFYADAMFDAHQDQIDNLFGPAYKGIPLAVVAAEALFRRHNLDVTYTFNRKEAKDHGEGGVLVGYDYGSVKKDSTLSSIPACRVVLVEDVTTAGTSVRESLPLIESRGAKVVGLVVSVDRMERGTGTQSALREISDAHGIKTTAIVSLSDLLDYLASPVGAKHIVNDPALLARMQACRETYGV